MTLTRRYHFSAAHRLWQPGLTAAENARLYGPCHRLHGHNYHLEVTVAGTPDPATGMLVDLAALDALVAERVLDRVDHRTLEEVPELAGVVTTGEGLARAFWGLLAGAESAAGLSGVVVEETAKNRFTWRGPGAPGAEEEFPA